MYWAVVYEENRSVLSFVVSIDHLGCLQNFFHKVISTVWLPSWNLWCTFLNHSTHPLWHPEVFPPSLIFKLLILLVNICSLKFRLSDTWPSPLQHSQFLPAHQAPIWSCPMRHHCICIEGTVFSTEVNYILLFYTYTDHLECFNKYFFPDLSNPWILMKSDVMTVFPSPLGGMVFISSFPQYL